MSDNKIDLKPVEIEGFGRVEDSRLKGLKRQTHPTLPLERTFCNLCGNPFGWVSTESYEFVACGEVIVFCNECEELIRTKLGSIPLKVAALDNAIDIPNPQDKDKLILGGN